MALAALVLALFVGLAVLGYRLFLSEALAKLTDASGQPLRDSATSIGKWTGAELGDEFFAGDGAKTKAETEAFFRLATGAKLTLRAQSQIRFHRSRQHEEIGLQVEMGEADIQTEDGQLTLDSEFGPIVIDPNSTITMRRTGQRLLVAVEIGQIKLGRSEQVVEAGSSAELELGGLVLDISSDDDSARPAAEDAEKADEPELELGDGVVKADLTVPAGQSFTVHDPHPPTAVGLSTSKVCPGPARLLIGDQVTESTERPALRVDAGRHQYEVRCLASPDHVAARGSFTIVRDAGTRPLPAFIPRASVAADGRTYTVLYQHQLPHVTVTWPSAPEADDFTLQVDGRSIGTTTPSYTLRSLSQGTHRVFFAASTSPPRQSRTTTIEVRYDSQAPKARVSDPPSEFAPSGQVKVSGQALPGWTVSINGRELEVNAARQFEAETSGESAFPIAFSHPTQGTHYYLRRPRASP